MNYFSLIHKNLYETYFKKNTHLRNWFDYFYGLYHIPEHQLSHFEGTYYNKYKSADKWLRNGKIDADFFIFDNENYLLRSDLCRLLSDKIKRNFKELNTSAAFQSLLHDMVFQPEQLKYPFSLPETSKNKLLTLFSACDATDFFSILLIFAQTGGIAAMQQDIREKCRMAEVYDKSVITEYFSELLENAVEVNMMQISVPSLMDKYADFYKTNNYSTLIQLLENGCRVNFIFSGHPYELQMQNNVYCWKNDFSLYGDVIKDSIDFARKLRNRYPQQIQIKITDYPIAYSLMIVKKLNAPAIAKVDLYLIKSNADERQSFIFRSNEDMKSYQLYQNNFFDVFHQAKDAE